MEFKALVKNKLRIWKIKILKKRKKFGLTSFGYEKYIAAKIKRKLKQKRKLVPPQM